MRWTWTLIGAVAAFGLLGQGLVAGAAHAGVPRACIHPQADPLECPRATREVTHKVMSSRRLRVLEARRHRLERVGQDWHCCRLDHPHDDHENCSSHRER